MIKPLLLSTFGFLLFGNLTIAQERATRTTTASGLATNPLIWDCLCVPAAGDNIVVNHTVTMNVDFAYTSGGITVNSSGVLNGDSPARAIAYTGGNFTNSGTVSLGNFYHGGGTFSNTGTFTAGNVFAVDGTANTVNNGNFYVNDSLYVNTNASFTSSGYLYTKYTASAGNITTTGNLVGDDLYNTGAFNNNGGTGVMLYNIYSSGTVSNNASMELMFDLWNSETFTNINHIIVGRNFWNGDTLAGSATFTNNGTISVAADLANSQTMNGSGHYCIGGASSNSGSVSGTLDICDLTGTNFDTNIGTIAGTVTFCSSSCSIGITEDMLNDTYSIFPNPVNNIVTVDMKTSGVYKLILFNSFGQIVLENSFSGSQKSIDLTGQAMGMYHYRIVGENKVVSGKLVKE